MAHSLVQLVAVVLPRQAGPGSGPGPGLVGLATFVPALPVLVPSHHSLVRPLLVRQMIARLRRELALVVVQQLDSVPDSPPAPGSGVCGVAVPAIEKPRLASACSVHAAPVSVKLTGDHSSAWLGSCCGLPKS